MNAKMEAYKEECPAENVEKEEKECQGTKP